MTSGEFDDGPSGLTLGWSTPTLRPASTNLRRDIDAELAASVSLWDGPAVFRKTCTPNRGSATSPISISSSPEVDLERQFGDKSALPRPRGVVRYESPLPRTAYTPPRITDDFSSPSKSKSRLADSTEPGSVADQQHAGSSSRTHTVHPFFTRDSRSRSTPPPSAPPPPSQNRPRLVAHYSSTDTSSQSQRTQSSQSTFGERRVSPPPRSHCTTGAGMSNKKTTAGPPAGWTDREVDDLVEGFSRVGIRSQARKPLESVRLPQELGGIPSRGHVIPSQPKGMGRPQPVQPRQPPTKPAYPSTTSSSSTFQTRPPANVKPPIKTAQSTLPLFHLAHLPRSATRPVKVAYTTDPSEANDLLSCLRGPVMGFDIEWPVAGTYKITNSLGVSYTKRIGMDWVGGAGGAGGTGWKWKQGKTALMQVCDGDFVVLVHLKDMTDLPSKAMEILQDPNIYKLGVQIRGDGQKLLRDFPEQLTHLSSLFELSYYARKVDPITTGPGSRLISLANLTEEYLRMRLSKDDNVRKSHWAEALSQEQKDYAANDVYASYLIYQALRAKADEAGLELDLRDFCSYLGNDPANPPGTSTSEEPISTSSKWTYEVTRPGGPSPSEARALRMFVSGLGSEAAALELGLKQSTVQTYIAGALSKSDNDTLTEADKRRFLDDTASNIWVGRNHRALIKRLRVELGEGADESGSEVEETVEL